MLWEYQYEMIEKLVSWIRIDRSVDFCSTKRGSSVKLFDMYMKK